MSVPKIVANFKWHFSKAVLGWLGGGAFCLFSFLNISIQKHPHLFDRESIEKVLRVWKLLRLFSRICLNVTFSWYIQSICCPYSVRTWLVRLVRFSAHVFALFLLLLYVNREVYITLLMTYITVSMTTFNVYHENFFFNFTLIILYSRKSLIWKSLVKFQGVSKSIGKSR